MCTGLYLIRRDWTVQKNTYEPVTNKIAGIFAQ